MNKSAAFIALVGILSLAACATEDRQKTQPVPVVTSTPHMVSINSVKIASSRLEDIEFLGKIFRVSYSLKNTTPNKLDYRITFEYLDASGARIGQNSDSVQSLDPGQSAKLSMDDYGFGGYKLTDIKSVRVAGVKTWPSQ